MVISYVGYVTQEIPLNGQKNIKIALKDDSEMKLISGLLDKMKIHSKVLSSDDMEDIGLGEMMLKVDRSDKVTREMVIKKLSGE